MNVVSLTKMLKIKLKISLNSSIKKDEIMPIFSNMNATRDYHAKWSKKEKKQITYDITYMWILKYDTNEPIHETETESRT